MTIKGMEVTKNPTFSDKTISEASFQKLITNLCDIYGFKWHHETDSRRSKPGFPDLVIVANKGVLFRELKTWNGRVRGEQKEWLECLQKAGADVAIWRPNHFRTNQIRTELENGR